ncbi:MAG: PHP domain-containing protein [Blastocatellia bacterium]|nr:PHP domain-containing protein [Blastocatellia bacterium]
MSNRIIDLHSHTVYSDGSDTPRDLVAMAASRGARAIAITDHDTVAGLEEGRAAAERIGIEFVDGIEISAEFSPGTMHILGYFINSGCARLKAQLEELKNARDRRNPEIAARLQSLGIDISYDEVERLAGNEIVGRPHFARILLDRGYVDSIQDAFDRFLAKGAAAYVEKKRLSPADSIDLIHRAGGVAVLAHPYQLKLSSLEELDRLVEDLAALGLDGIEAVYSRHSQDQRDMYAEMAERHHLLITGGSDYHGTYKPDIRLVEGLGDLQVPYSLLEKIKARASDRRNEHIC